MPTTALQCPYCEKTSSAPQGLSSHIRNSHKKQFPKWIKDPNRLKPVEAKSQSRPKGVNAPPPSSEPLATVAEPPQATEAHATAPDGDGTLELLNQARRQLADRKQAIESQLAQMDHLRTELAQVNAQIESLDGTLGVFKT
jgi:hypothetical protein